MNSILPTATSGDVQHVELRPKRSGWTLPFRLLSMLLGGFGLLLSSILFITIIGIIPAIGLGAMSMGLVYVGMNRQPVKCPHCSHGRNYVRNGALNFACRKCRHLMVIDWLPNKS
jgi:hypothetical protein